MQTAFVALCYFCENHGPRIVFTCQTIKNSELKFDKLDNRKQDEEVSQTEEIPQICNNFIRDGIIDDELRCAACSSFDGGMGMITKVNGNEFSFVSTQIPSNERQNQILKQASLRSLSVEVSEPLQAGIVGENFIEGVERDGIVLFGDDENWYTLSYTFKQMQCLLKVLTSFDKDIVLEGCPTQDMLNLVELSNSGSLKDEELIMQLTPKFSQINLNNLRYIANFFKNNDPSLLDEFIWHVIVGEQIVVRSDLPRALQLFLFSLIQLIPIGCVNLSIENQKHCYEYDYNFLGCPLTTQIPKHVYSKIFLIQILAKEDSSSNKSNKAIYGLPFAVEDVSLEEFKIIVESYPVRENSDKPAVVTRYIQLLLDPLVNNLTLESALRALRNDWLNNAKLIFQIRHQRQEMDLDRILRIIKCKPQGLSKRYKELILQTINRKHVV